MQNNKQRGSDFDDNYSGNKDMYHQLGDSSSKIFRTSEVLESMHSSQPAQHKMLAGQSIRYQIQKQRTVYSSSSSEETPSIHDQRVKNLRLKLEEVHQRRVSQPSSIRGENEEQSSPEPMPHNEQEFIDLVEAGGSNYDKRFIKNMKADIFDSQMVYRPKNRQMSEEKSVEYRREKMQMDGTYKNENLYNDRLIGTRKAPKASLKRGQSQEDNKFDRDFVLDPYDSTKVPQIQKGRPTSETRKEKIFNKRQNHKKMVGFNEKMKEPQVGIPPLTPTLNQRDQAPQKTLDVQQVPKLDIRQHQNDLIIQFLNQQVSALISNGHQILTYQDESQTGQFDNDSNSSIGTISSADEREMGLLFNGDHIYQFQAIQTVKSIVKMHNQQSEQHRMDLKVLESRWQRFKDFISCVDKTKRQSRIASIRTKLQYMDNPTAVLFGELGVSGTFVKSSERAWRQKNTARMLSSKKLQIEDLSKQSKNNAGVKLTPTSQNTPTAQVKPIEKSSSDKKEVLKSGDNQKDNSLILKKRTSLWDRARHNKDVQKSPKFQGKNQNISGEPNEITENDKYDYGRNDQSSYQQNQSNMNEDDYEEQEEGEQKDVHHHEDCEMGYISSSQKEKSCREKISERYMIDPSNSRLKKFHILVSFSYYFDFILTSFVVGNYQFQIGENENFMNHSTLFFYINCVQVIDIVLNFLKIQITDLSRINDPMVIGKNYIFGEFIFDVVAVLPWSTIKRQYTFIRYLKFRKINVYQQYVDDLIQDMTQHFLNNQQLKKLKSCLRLILKIIFITHFFANLWVLIGLRGLNTLDADGRPEGWIIEKVEGELMVEEKMKDFIYLYIISIYWIITSFSSVGYGDITGNTVVEYIFQMIVEMIGIGFFGYMIGTFQQLLKGFRVKDLKAEYQDEIDLWLIQLDKSRKSVILSKSIFKEVRNFYSFHFRYDAVHVRDTPFFDQLKPRLKKAVLDTVFHHFYQSFHNIFEGCGIDFQRDIFNNSKFNYLGQKAEQEDEKCDWLKDEELPIIEPFGQKSEQVHFILSGNVHIMNSNAMYEYAVLQEGNYFGDISILLDQPSGYSYCYDPHKEKALMMMSMKAEKFIEICEFYPLAKSILTERAIKRAEMFDNYKNIMLLKYMKVIRKNPNILRPNSKPTNKAVSDGVNQPQKQRNIDIQLKLFDALIKHYQFYRQLFKITKKFSIKGYQHKDGNNIKNKQVDLDQELREARQKAIQVDKLIQKKRKQALLMEHQVSENKESEGTQEFTQVQKKTETPNIRGERKKKPGINQEIYKFPEKNVRENSEGGNKENLWDDYRSDSPNNNEEVQFEIPQSLQQSVQVRITEVKSHQHTDTPRYESVQSELNADVRAIQSKNKFGFLNGQQDLNPEGGQLSDSQPAEGDDLPKMIKPIRIEFRSKSVDQIEGGSLESSLSLSPIRRDETPLPRPSIELKQLSTIKASKSSSSKSKSNKSNKNLKPPLNPKNSQFSSSGSASQVGSGSGTGNQKSGGSKTSSGHSNVGRNTGDVQYNKNKGLKVYTNKYKFGKNSHLSSEQPESASPVEFMDDQDDKLPKNEAANESLPHQVPTSGQIYDSLDRDLNQFDKQDDAIGKSQEPQQIFENQIEQSPPVNLSQEPRAIQDNAILMQKETNILNQSFGNNGGSKILLNSPDKEERTAAAQISQQDSKKPAFLDRLTVHETEPQKDNSARYILKDIIEKDYKQLNIDQLTVLIDQNKDRVDDLLKEYFKNIKQENQKLREMTRRMAAEQCMRRFSVRQNKKQPQQKINLPNQNEPSRHVDMILQEYLNIKNINSKFTNPNPSQKKNNSVQESESTIKDGVKPSLEFKKKPMVGMEHDVKFELRKQNTINDVPAETPSFIPAGMSTKANASIKTMVENVTPNDSKIPEDVTEGQTVVPIMPPATSPSFTGAPITGAQAQYKDCAGIPNCPYGPTCNNFEQLYYYNMKSLQASEFKKLKDNICGNIVDQIKQFTEKFESQMNIAEEQINKSIIQRLQEVNDKFEMLDAKDKDYFLEKLEQKEMRDRLKISNPSQPFLKTEQINA